MQQKLVIKLGLLGLTSPALVEKGRAHIAKCTGNPDVTLPANFLTDFTAACDALEAASINSQQNGGKVDTLLRMEREREVGDFIRRLAGIVEEQCLDDLEKITGTGFEVRKPAAPVGVPDAPRNLRAKRCSKKRSRSRKLRRS